MIKKGKKEEEEKASEIKKIRKSRLGTLITPPLIVFGFGDECLKHSCIPASVLWF